MSSEIALMRTLMQKEFYDTHKGIRCPDELFTKDVRKIKQTLDYAMETYGEDVTPSELEALFFAHNSTLTTATKLVYRDMFSKISKAVPMNTAMAEEVMSRLFQQVVGEKVANIGFDYVNGSAATLEPIRALLEYYGDDFMPSMKVDWDDMSIDKLLELNGLEAHWKFNIPSLKRRIEGINGGHLVMVGARPNVGKTSFHASLVAGEGGFAQQGAKCYVLVNEEAYHRVGARYLTAASNMTLAEIKENPALAAHRYEKVKNNIYVKDCTGRDLAWVEQIIKAGKPDVVVLDMGDKFAKRTSDKSDVFLKDAAIYARNIGKQYGCAILWLSQLSADAEGKVMVDMSMMEGSKTGKAAEADLMLLLSKNQIVEGAEEADTQRHINIAKNKLSGWHGIIHCELDGERGIYSA